MQNSGDNESESCENGNKISRCSRKSLFNFCLDVDGRYRWNKNKIDPGKAFDQDLYSLTEDEVKKLPTVCGSLREAMQNLDKDRKFLTEGGVFTDDQIDAYIELKFQEIYKFEHTPHPIEFEMYYSG